MPLLTPVPYEWTFRACALKWGVPAMMMAGMSKEASGFKPTIMGPTDDRGLMQVIGSNAAGCGTTPEGLFDPKTNVCCAASLLKKHFDRVKPFTTKRRDLWRLVMMANNMGSHFVTSRLTPGMTWEEFKAATPTYAGKHAWIEKMASTADKYWWTEVGTWSVLLTGIGFLAWYGFFQ